VLPSAGFCSRFGRYRHLPPNPRRRRPIPRRSWVIFLRGVWLFGCSKQGQPDAQKAAGLCRACWVFLERILNGTRFSLCGRVELLRRMGGVTTANGWSYYGTAGWSYYGKKAGNVTTAKDPTSAVLAGLWRSPSAGLAQGLADTDTCPQAPARSAANTWALVGYFFEGCLGVWLFKARPARRPKGGGAVPRLTDLNGSVNTA